MVPGLVAVGVVVGDPSNGNGSPKCTGAFRGADLWVRIQLVNVDMTDADLNAANLSYAEWNTNDANPTNFTGADLVDANFGGAATGVDSTGNFIDVI